MASTTNYAWSTPDDTAYVKDGASAMRTLGSAIDTTTKALNPSTTLGDIEYRSSTANTNTRLGIGSTGQVLTVAAGVPSWANAAAGVDPVLTPEVSAQVITNFVGAGGAGSFTPTATTTYYMPIYLPTASFDRIVFKTGATFTTAGNSRLGLYNASTTTGLPTTVAFDAGVVNVTAANAEYTITISQSITAGWYYFAYNRQSGTYTALTAASSQGNNPQLSAQTTLGSFSNTDQIQAFSQASVTGAFATAGTLTKIIAANATYPLMGMRLV